MNKNYKNMEAFAERFKELIDEYREKVITSPDIIKYEEIRKDDKKILKHLLIVKVTKGFWRYILISDCDILKLTLIGIEWGKAYISVVCIG